MKVSLASQIAAVQNVVAGRSPFTRDQQLLQQEHLRAALETLRWVKANEAVLRSTRKAAIGGRL
ncbi:hypothetical protein FP2506_11577 [Fulvimarina pelagi HTCC2506]|uniref:Uncharacterized protein n=1 Tax=Fulvimarina pelagi HTCC2506 TaxID=314231 RepID=Q0FYW4_9HYPH|nr:hypothetical protein [Fulvimarina pelagi]EAU40194.1 hypothetical protein FP2506_11577 [Fulvimarina pelagi HTCC2506]